MNASFPEYLSGGFSNDWNCFSNISNFELASLLTVVAPCWDRPHGASTECGLSTESFSPIKNKATPLQEMRFENPLVSSFSITFIRNLGSRGYTCLLSALAFSLIAEPCVPIFPSQSQQSLVFMFPLIKHWLTTWTK